MAPSTQRREVRAVIRSTILRSNNVVTDEALGLTALRAAMAVSLLHPRCLLLPPALVQRRTGRARSADAGMQRTGGRPSAPAEASRHVSSFREGLGFNGRWCFRRGCTARGRRGSRRRESAASRSPAGGRQLSRRERSCRLRGARSRVREDRSARARPRGSRGARLRALARSTPLFGDRRTCELGQALDLFLVGFSYIPGSSGQPDRSSPRSMVEPKFRPNRDSDSDRTIASAEGRKSSPAAGSSAPSSSFIPRSLRCAKLTRKPRRRASRIRS